MKRFNSVLLAAGLALGTTLVGTSSAMAETTGSVPIGGTVDSTLSLTVEAIGLVATDLDLGGKGIDLPEQIVKVADLVVTTNNDAGLKLTITSGDLVAPGGATPLPYKVVTVADGAAAPVGGDFATNSGTPREENYTQVGGAAPNLGANGSLARDLYISYDPPQLLDAGNYASTINLTVTDL